MQIPFTPTGDVSTIINRLLDIYERRGGASKQAIRVQLVDLAKKLPGYYTQTDPNPRTTTNEQLTRLEQLGLIRLEWQPAQTGHLLERVTLGPDGVAPLYQLLERQPLAEQRQELRQLLLGYRPHLSGWRRGAVEHYLKQLKALKSPAPFSLNDIDWNEDLLTVLQNLPDEAVKTEIAYRVFSVRVFNDSKRFESLKDTVARLARRHNPLWQNLSPPETLREMGLVANPGHLYLYGPWRLVDGEGQVMSLAEFYPSVGIPAALATRLRQVKVDAPGIICVENLASFYEAARYEGQRFALMCLWGNPSPAARHLLRCLADNLLPDTPLYLWADIDYGGLNILAQLRQFVSAKFRPHLMDAATLDTYARWGHPLSGGDVRNLARLRRHPALGDMLPLIDHILLQEIKLEQEAVVFKPPLLFAKNLR